MDLKIDIQAVESTISSLTTSIQNAQSEISSAYSSMTGAFAESSGEEADALREQQTAEDEMFKEMCTLLEKFTSSIQFAAKELEGLDRTGAKSMY